MSVDWYSTKPGHYTTRYQGKTLEVIRNSNGQDKRRYLAVVNGLAWPHPCHTIPQAKSKAMRWAENPGLHQPNGGALVSESTAVVVFTEPPEHPPPEPDMPDVLVDFKITILGQIPAGRYVATLSQLQAAVDMLRDIGGTVECEINQPSKVKL